MEMEIGSDLRPSLWIRSNSPLSHKGLPILKAFPHLLKGFDLSHPLAFADLTTLAALDFTALAIKAGA